MLIEHDSYQKVTRETSGCDELPILALGLVGETIEFLSSYESIAKPGLENSVFESCTHIIKEAGDVLWYAARIMDVMGIKLSEWRDKGTVDNFNKSCVKKKRRFRILKNAAKVSEHIKKVYGHGHDLDKNLVHEALSDVIRDISHMLRVVHGPTGLDVAMNVNIEKLKKRYPNGFSTQDSINRSFEDC